MAKIVLIIVLLMVCTSAIAMPHDHNEGNCYSCHTLSGKEAEALLRPLDAKVKSIAPSQISGLFEVTAEREGKSGIVFVDFSKKHLMQGVMVKADDFKSGKTKVLDKSDLARLLRTNSVLMGNPSAPRQLIVFSDPDCPFCREMHNELKQLLSEVDVAIYIKPYPLDIHPSAYAKAQTILETNSSEILDKAFRGEDIPAPKRPEDKSGVEDNIELAKSLHIKGAPAILLPSGKVEVGFRNAATLKKLLMEK